MQIILNRMEVERFIAGDDSIANPLFASLIDVARKCRVELELRVTERDGDRRIVQVALGPKKLKD